MKSKYVQPVLTIYGKYYIIVGRCCGKTEYLRKTHPEEFSKMRKRMKGGNNSTRRYNFSYIQDILRDSMTYEEEHNAYYLEVSKRK